MKLHVLALLTLASGALLGACIDDEPVAGRPVALTPAAITGAAEVNTRLVAQALWDAQRWLDQSITLTDLEDVLLPSEATEEPVAAAGGANFLVFPQSEDDEFEAALDDIVAFLDERVFADAAIESQSGTQVIYRVTSERFCDPAWGESEEDADLYESCTGTLDAIEVRLAVTSYAEGDLDIAVLVGADRRETMVIELHRTLLAVTVRIGPTLAAALEIDAAMNADDPEYVAPTLSGSGSVRIAARRLTETRTRVAVELPDALEIHGQPGPDEPVVTFAAGPGSTSLDVDRVAQTGQLDVDLRDFAISGPKQMLQDVGGDSTMTCFDGEGYELECYPDETEEPTPVEGTFELSISRLAGLIDLSDEQQELAVQGLIAGPIALLLDEQRVFGLDVDGGQTPVDLTMVPADDRVDFALSHAATLSASFRMEDAADLWPDIAESFLAHDDLTARFDGDAPRFSVRETGLLVESGAIALSSSARPDLDRTLEAGICAWYDDQGDWAEGGSGSASADGTDGSPLPPVDETDGGADEAQHLFDFATGDTCPEADAPPVVYPDDSSYY
ncbi:MAG: hypothetical protein EP329_26965 [Deltaproteobacteria bacterium]|nr:MAG: hypothetical protein EP329_26965 [Deltaproteobacteria bacterium]